MKFICLKYRDGDLWDRIPEQDRLVLQNDAMCYDENLRKSGLLFASDHVLAAGEALGLSSYQGQLSIAHGPSASSREEQLEGLMFLEARDLNHAILLVADHPGIKVGWFKIHPAEDRGGKP